MCFSNRPRCQLLFDMQRGHTSKTKTLYKWISASSFNILHISTNVTTMNDFKSFIKPNMWRGIKILMAFINKTAKRINIMTPKKISPACSSCASFSCRKMVQHKSKSFWLLPLDGNNYCCEGRIACWIWTNSSFWPNSKNSNPWRYATAAQSLGSPSSAARASVTGSKRSNVLTSWYGPLPGKRARLLTGSMQLSGLLMVG